MTVNRVSLKERIALSGDFTPEEAAFILHAVNQAPPGELHKQMPLDNEMPRINEMWAYLSVDHHGNEGVCAAPIGRGITAALCAADIKRLRELRPTVVLMARMWRRPIRLVRFHKRRDEELIEPPPDERAEWIR